MDQGLHAPPASLALPWLADLVGPQGREVVARDCGSAPALALAAVSRGVGCRRELARSLGQGEALGVDLVHAAVNTLLASGALPHIAAMHVQAPRASALAEAITAGIARACRAHDLAIVVGSAVQVEAPEELGIVLTGGIVAPSPTNLAAEDVVLALRGSGPSDGDLDALLARARGLGLTLADRLANGDTVGRTLVAARKSHFSLLQQPLRERWPGRVIAVGDRGLAAAASAALPTGLRVDWSFAGWQPPAPFAEWFQDRGEVVQAAASSSFGCGMMVVVSVAEAPRWQRLCAAWNEPATVLGQIVAAQA